MKLSLDLGHREIRAVAIEDKAVKKKFVIQTPSLEGGIISNIQETAEAITSAFIEQSIKIKECRFVLPSNIAAIREMKIPDIIDKDLNGYVRTQFSSIMDVQDQDIIDCIETDEGESELNALGLLIPRVYIEQCFKLSKAAGLRCSKVDIRTNVLRKYMKAHPVNQNNSYIVTYLENGVAEINLYENEKLFVRVSELSGQEQQGSDSLLKNWATNFNESLVVATDKESYAKSLGEQLESIVNFQYTRNRIMPVSHIYIYGKVDIQLQTELQDMMQLPVSFLTREEDLTYVTAEGSAMNVQVEQDIHLAERLNQRTPEQKEKLRKIVRFAAILGAVLLVELIVSVGMNMANGKLQKSIRDTQAYLADKKVMEQAAQADDVKKVLADQIQYNEILKRYNNAFENMTRFSSSYLDGIQQQIKNYNITLEYCNYQEGKVSITAYAADSSVAAQFAGALESNQVISDIVFEGYQKSYQDANANYKFQLNGTIGEGL